MFARAHYETHNLREPAYRVSSSKELGSTEAYWTNWFTGMSAKFLSGKGAKLLILAGTDRLDKELMIGQMQGTIRFSTDYIGYSRTSLITHCTGKFQLQVFPASGHFLHEDQPDKTAEVIIEFVRRNDRSAMVMPPKVADLIAQGKV
jgi:protein phosphatase methylesterase 1